MKSAGTKLDERIITIRHLSYENRTLDFGSLNPHIHEELYDDLIKNNKQQIEKYTATLLKQAIKSAKMRIKTSLKRVPIVGRIAVRIYHLIHKSF